MFMGFSRITSEAPFEQFRETQNGIHRRADLMTHIGQEGTLGLVGGFGGLFGLEYLDFCFFQLSDVIKANHDTDILASASKDGGAVDHEGHTFGFGQSQADSPVLLCLTGNQRHMPGASIWFQRFAFGTRPGKLSHPPTQ